MSTDVVGYCPMGCGRTLFLAKGGHITCRYSNCPNPCAVDDLLDDAETEHIVTFRPGDFTIRHPLRERIGDALMACELHAHVAALPGPPVTPGRYRAARRSSEAQRWTWERLDSAQPPDLLVALQASIERRTAQTPTEEEN